MTSDGFRPRLLNSTIRSHFSTLRLNQTLNAASTAFLDPERDDAVAALGELTGETALRDILTRMMADDVGRRIVQERWEITEATMKIEELPNFPKHSFGRCYSNFLRTHGFSPDERKPVQHIQDPELAYVMQRYRQVHDFWHVLCGIQPTVLGEIAIKWFEMVQTQLPVATLSAFIGPLRLAPSEMFELWTRYVPWAASSAKNSKFLMNVPYEEHLLTDIYALRKELGIVAFDEYQYVEDV